MIYHKFLESLCVKFRSLNTDFFLRLVHKVDFTVVFYLLLKVPFLEVINNAYMIHILPV